VIGRRSAHLLISSIVLAALGCAPLVSRRSEGPYRRASALERATATAANAPEQHPVPPKTEAQVIAREEVRPIMVAEKTVAEAPVARVERVEAKPVIDKETTPVEPTVSAEPGKKKDRRLPEFTDAEINALRKQSREFKKLHDQWKGCASRSPRQRSKRIDCASIESKVTALLNETYAVEEDPDTY
jgi:hypothetical protein